MVSDTSDLRKVEIGVGCSTIRALRSRCKKAEFNSRLTLVVREVHKIESLELMMG
jgi:hypothetical protein